MLPEWFDEWRRAFQADVIWRDVRRCGGRDGNGEGAHGIAWRAIECGSACDILPGGEAIRSAGNGFGGGGGNRAGGGGMWDRSRHLFSR